MPLVLLKPEIGSYQVLPLRARVDLGAMAMKGFSAFPKATASDCLVSYQDTRWGRVLPLCREEVGVFYSPRRRGKSVLRHPVYIYIYIYIYKSLLKNALVKNIRLMKDDNTNRSVWTARETMFKKNLWSYSMDVSWSTRVFFLLLLYGNK